ncbi:MAG: response regulator, partial [Phenylobacterium sp.]|nr:response regulator [Phenylobacterium sp.]
TYYLVLIDIQMPVRDAITAASSIREAERATGRRRTPIVALTANALTHQVEEYLAVGMDAHVAKPIAIAKLYDAISAVLTAAATDGVSPSQAGAAA